MNEKSQAYKIAIAIKRKMKKKTRYLDKLGMRCERKHIQQSIIYRDSTGQKG